MRCAVGSGSSSSSSCFGTPTVFVSWWLGTPLANILDALEWSVTLQDGGFAVQQDAFVPLDCTLDGMDFSCPATLETDVTEWPAGSSQTGDPDVTNYTNGTVAGTFSDAETASIIFSPTVTCEGADCDAYGAEVGAPSPCDSVIEGNFMLNQG